MTFSQRMGFIKARDAIQVDSLDTETRVALWNVIAPYLGATLRAIEVTAIKEIWTEVFHLPIDSIPNQNTHPYVSLSNDELRYRYIKDSFLGGEWNRCLDLLEFLANNENRNRWDDQGVGVFDDDDVVAPKPSEYNLILKKYMVGYRFVSGILSRITSEDEIDSVESAIENAATSVEEQLYKALQDLSDREHPHYAKSVQCSISAVEAQCCILLGEERVTLGDALNRLERQGVNMHSALKEAWKKLYGFTSDDAGIRHGSMQPSDVDQDLARFMLVACSAFVTYLISKGGSCAREST